MIKFITTKPVLFVYCLMSILLFICSGAMVLLDIFNIVEDGMYGAGMGVAIGLLPFAFFFQSVADDLEAK